MTIQELHKATPEQIQMFIDAYALDADLQDQATVNMLHAAKNKLIGIWARSSVHVKVVIGYVKEDKHP